MLSDVFLTEAGSTSLFTVKEMSTKYSALNKHSFFVSLSSKIKMVLHEKNELVWLAIQTITQAREQSPYFDMQRECFINASISSLSKLKQHYWRVKI